MRTRDSDYSANLPHINHAHLRVPNQPNFDPHYLSFYHHQLSLMSHLFWLRAHFVYVTKRCFRFEYLDFTFQIKHLIQACFRLFPYIGPLSVSVGLTTVSSIVWLKSKQINVAFWTRVPTLEIKHIGTLFTSPPFSPLLGVCSLIFTYLYVSKAGGVLQMLF